MEQATAIRVGKCNQKPAMEQATMRLSGGAYGFERLGDIDDSEDTRRWISSMEQAAASSTIGDNDREVP